MRRKPTRPSFNNLSSKARMKARDIKSSSHSGSGRFDSPMSEDLGKTRAKVRGKGKDRTKVRR